MNILSNPLHITQKSVATLGFFDGVHLGHRFLLNELKNIAADRHLPSTIITFTEHPRKILHADYQPKLLSTLAEKTELLQSTGIDNCILLDFTNELSQLSAREFIQDILFNKLNITTLLVGYDHRFGHNRSETFDDYCRYGNQIGLEVINTAKYENADFTNISSSEIRKSLLNGETQQANAMLGYNYSLQGTVIHGLKNGRKLGFPTANIAAAPEKLTPASGVYAAKVQHGDRVFEGMLNIGYRPTFGSKSALSVEVNIFDFSAEIYGDNIKIWILDKIRNETKFDSLQMLAAQLGKDAQQIREMFLISD
ncbi:MAG: bifunctional riboflavin kinase/FAD synthetase [Paludibacter sp.]|nr:bifunctional riboflavin kinase/FAD synthetase [Paludibacter sp.]